MNNEIYTSKICATSRASIKLKEAYYTLEWQEERIIPQDISEEDLIEARQLLWNTVNEQVDNAIEDTINALQNNR